MQDLRKIESMIISLESTADFINYIIVDPYTNNLGHELAKTRKHLKEIKSINTENIVAILEKIDSIGDRISDIAYDLWTKGEEILNERWYGGIDIDKCRNYFAKAKEDYKKILDMAKEIKSLLDNVTSEMKKIKNSIIEMLAKEQGSETIMKIAEDYHELREAETHLEEAQRIARIIINDSQHELEKLNQYLR